MLETKTVTGTWLVEKTTHLYDLTIAPGAELKAPEGKFIAMTVDGIGYDPKPGRYHGDIVLTVAETYHMAPHALMRLNNISREFTDAVVIDSGKVVEEKCVPELIQKGTVTGETAEGVYLSSNAESFNGILVTGDQPYLVKDCRMELDGFGANDFMGVGSAVAAIDTADVTIDGCDFTVNGVTLVCGSCRRRQPCDRQEFPDSEYLPRLRLAGRFRAGPAASWAPTGSASSVTTAP